METPSMSSLFSSLHQESALISSLHWNLCFQMTKKRRTLSVLFSKHHRCCK